MFFILQKEREGLDLECFIVKNILDNNRYTDEYTLYNLDDFAEKNVEYPDYIKSGIPVGTINFVEKWLKRFCGIERINPIEVPVCLRKEEFLKREYSIVKKDDIPKTGTYFVKDASQLKKFANIVDVKSFFNEDIWKPRQRELDTTLHLDPTHLFQVSESVNIHAEYRIYVQDDEIEAIANYNGDPCLLPDIRLIQKMVNIYSMQSSHPNAYTMDIAINERGTFLLEVHPWIAVGLYNSLWNRKLLYAYRDGLQYVLDYNVKPSEFHIS